MRLIKLEKQDDFKVEYKITYYLDPDFLYLPVNREMYVKQNEQIYKGDLVVKDGVSPVSGIAYGIKKCNINGKLQDTLVIENDFREISKKDKKKKINITIPNLLNILEKNKKDKLLRKFKSGGIFKNIVVGVINDEPYVINKILILKENIINIIELINELSLIYKSENNMVVIKNNESFVIDECLNVIGTYPNINITLVNDEYLIGQESILLSKLGLKNNTLYLDVEDLLELNYIINGKNIDTKLITIFGNGLVLGKTIRVKIGTMLEDVLEKFIDISSNNYQIIINGLMTGYEIKSIRDFVITKEVDNVCILKKIKKKKQECIRCGKCIEVCPFMVNPLNRKNNKCIDCGLCSYICPVYINLR